MRPKALAQSPGSLADRVVEGELVTTSLIDEIAAQEKALRDARLASEALNRRLRFHQDHRDAELVAALDACRQLEQEKLTAFGVDQQGHANLFISKPLSPGSALTWDGLRERLRAAHEEQLSNQAQRYFRELQESAVKNAEVARQQILQWQARLEEARRHAEIAADHRAEERFEEAGRLHAAERLEDNARHRAEQEQVRAAHQREIAGLLEDLHAARREAAAAGSRVHQLLSSTSWRVSRPLRGVSRVWQWLARQ